MYSSHLSKTHMPLTKSGEDSEWYPQTRVKIVACVGNDTGPLLKSADHPCKNWAATASSSSSL